MDVKSLLEDWGLENLWNIFEENDVDMDAFNNLTLDMINELIPKVGPRAKFLSRYNIFKAPCKFVLTDVSTEHLYKDVSSASSLEDLVSSDSADTCDFNLSDSDAISSNASGSSTLPTNTIATPASVYPVGDNRTWLQSVLEQSPKGKIILNNYLTNKTLKNIDRDTLVQIIIDNEIGNELDKRVSPDRFSVLAQAIKLVFPTETEISYFGFAYKRDSGGRYKKIGGGKLFRKYYNRRRSLHASGLLKKRKAAFTTEELAGDEDVINEEVLWLQNSCEPWTEVETRWQNTFLQRSIYRTNEFTIEQYMNSFPALKLKLGYTLLEMDFRLMFPDTEQIIYSEFINFAKKIIAYAGNNKSKEIIQFMNIFKENLSQDVYNINVLFLLPLLLKPVVVKKGKSGTWKPTKLEVTEGFIIHVKIPADIKPALKRIEAKLSTFGLTLQPIPIIVGETLNNIISSYVAVNNIIYQVATPLKAVDICFKTIHSLNATYSKQSEQVWILLQKGLYGITTEWDGKFQAVENILQELRR